MLIFYVNVLKVLENAYFKTLGRSTLMGNEGLILLCTLTFNEILIYFEGLMPFLFGRPETFNLAFLFLVHQAFFGNSLPRKE